MKVGGGLATKPRSFVSRDIRRSVEVIELGAGRRATGCCGVELRRVPESGWSSSHLRSQYLAGHFSCAPNSSICSSRQQTRSMEKGWRCMYTSHLCGNDVELLLLPVIMSGFEGLNLSPERHQSL